ncbi:MAG: hypothetical protein QHJ73_04720, partial [Armatimonadota bacterium]|nr:hypothetical protein [Armatimonadota bacterium]
MRYSIGYQLPDQDDSIVEIARDYREHVAEVYFALPGEASGRSPVDADPEAREAMEADLAALSEMGVGLVLLYNAACYGDAALTRGLADRVCRQTEVLLGRYRLTAVTTTSPFIARVLKERFPSLEMRASVNMRIGTIKGMEYQSSWFDGFYLQRELNRDPARIEELKGWCDREGKSLHLLANSGCLAHCSSQTFHDNLVAHEAGICTQENVPSRYPSPCWEYLARREHWPAFLQNTWIRPEDLHHYERWF